MTGPGSDPRSDRPSLESDITLPIKLHRADQVFVSSHCGGASITVPAGQSADEFRLEFGRGQFLCLAGTVLVSAIAFALSMLVIH